MNLSLSLPCSAADLVPHKPPILCVDKVLAVADENEAKATSLVRAIAPEAGPFLCDNQILPEYFIELLAQSVAAVQGFHYMRSNRPIPEGMLAAIDHFTMHHQVVPGDALSVSLWQTMNFGSISVVEGAVSRDECILAQGRLKIWHQDQPEENGK